MPDQNDKKNWTNQFTNKLTTYLRRHHKEYWGDIYGPIDKAVRFIENNPTADFQNPPPDYYENSERAFGLLPDLLKMHQVFVAGNFSLYFIFLDCKKCPSDSPHYSMCKEQSIALFDVWWSWEV